jgi:hypothetical protein
MYISFANHPQVYPVTVNTANRKIPQVDRKI